MIYPTGGINLIVNIVIIVIHNIKKGVSFLFKNETKSNYLDNYNARHYNPNL